jgi:hypothetical protein
MHGSFHADFLTHRSAFDVTKVPQAGPSAGVVVVLGQLLFDELNEVAACVVKDGHDSGADVGRRLREYDAGATAVPLFNSDESFRTGSVRSPA